MVLGEFRFRGVKRKFCARIEYFRLLPTRDIGRIEIPQCRDLLAAECVCYRYGSGARQCLASIQNI
jgi:hypothetical protein